MTEQLTHADFVVWECPCPEEKNFQVGGNRHVIHPAGHCPFCGRSREEALAELEETD